MRQEREVGKGRNGGQVARTGMKRTKESGNEGKSAKGKGTERGPEPSDHLWNSCGSEAGKDERKQTES